MKKTIVALLALASTLSPAWAKDIFVAPTGDDSAAGTIEAPYRTIKKGIQQAKAGDNIYLREGTYKPAQSETMRTGISNVYTAVYDLTANGTAQKPITLSGYEDEKVKIDLSAVKPDTRVIGFHMKGNYWHLKKFDIVGIQVTQTGHTQSINVALFGGSHCIIEQVNMHDGMGIGVYATHGSDNLVLNCDAYNNYDPVSENGKGGNCDGFGFHLNKATYTGNVVRGCRAWRNSDDGYDLINNWAPVTIENCWAWENGYDANRVSRGDGTGFKSGGYGMSDTPKVPPTIPRNTVRNCLAWSNKQAGFYSNHHLGGLDFINNTAIRNKRNFNMVCRKSASEAVDVPGYGHTLANNVSHNPTQSHYENLDQAQCTVTNNSFLPKALSLTDGSFESVDASQLKRPRQADGSLPEITFMRLKESTDAYKAGMGYQFSGATNAITSPTVDEDGDAPFYNLQGVRVDSPTKGIYIRGGKKILLR